MKIKTQGRQITGTQQNSSKKEIYGNKGLPQERRNISNSLTLQLKKEEAKTTTKAILK